MEAMRQMDAATSVSEVDRISPPSNRRWVTTAIVASSIEMKATARDVAKEVAIQTVTPAARSRARARTQVGTGNRYRRSSKVRTVLAWISTPGVLHFAPPKGVKNGVALRSSIES